MTAAKVARIFLYPVFDGLFIACPGLLFTAACSP
jgi:hypothetical protein